MRLGYDASADDHCDIYGPSVCELRQAKASFQDTKSGALHLGFFTDEHVIGGLPKPNYFSIAGGSLTTLPATY
jgi:hypothetical protein